MIEKATLHDLPQILAVYEIARNYMTAHGNPTQWGNSYPPVTLLQQDIAKGQLYIDHADAKICGVFMLQTEPDPTYDMIEGAWLWQGPYATIHRIASSGRSKGVFDRCIQFCKQHHPHLRIDTHEDNHIMHLLIQKHGFKRCGIITVADGTKRVAYEYHQSLE